MTTMTEQGGSLGGPEQNGYWQDVGVERELGRLVHTLLLAVPLEAPLAPFSPWFPHILSDCSLKKGPVGKNGI